MGLIEMELAAMKDIDYTKKYHILSFFSMASLISAVNVYIEHGYTPHGAPQFVIESETRYYVQAVTLGNTDDILARLSAIEETIQHIKEKINAKDT